MILRIALIASLLALAACSSSPVVDSGTPERMFAVAQKYEKDERYDEALAQYAQVKNKHPYSNLATESELRIADIYFKREDYAEAQGTYESFKELHPAYSKIDFVTYRLGLSLYNQLPSTIDRDLSLATKSILYFDEVLTSFPKSEYVGPSRESKEKLLNMLAEKELYIGDFYFKRDRFDSALGRYEELLAKYPNSTWVPAALKGAAISARRMENSTKAKEYLARLEKQFANSKEWREAKGAIGE